MSAADSGRSIADLEASEGRLGYTKLSCPNCSWWVEEEQAELVDAHVCPADHFDGEPADLVDVSDVESPEEYVAKFVGADGDVTYSTFLKIAEDALQRRRSERVRLLFGFDAFDYQQAILDDPNPDVSVNMGRQVGKTETGGVIGADAALFSAYPDDADVGFYGDVADTAVEMFRRCKKHLKQCPIPLDVLGVDRDNETYWEFVDNGTRILTGSLNNGGDNERGKLPKVAIVDEAALCDRSSFGRVIEPMFMTWGDDHELYVMSTPRGQTGYHYDANTPGRDPDYFSSHCVPSWGNPLVAESWLEKKRDNTDSDTWEQEYLGRPISDGNAYIPTSLYRTCIADVPLRDDFRRGTWVEGHPKPDTAYFGGCDIAGAGDDRTVYLIMSEDGLVVYVENEETSTTPDVVGRIGELYETWDFERFHVDENSLGQGVANYSAIDPQLGAVVDGVTFGLKSKSNMYKTLKKSFEGEEIAVPKHGLLERETTRLDYKFSANRHVQVSHPQGGHDDHPDALALANLARSTMATGGSTRRSPGGPSKRSRRPT